MRVERNAFYAPPVIISAKDCLDAKPDPTDADVPRSPLRRHLSLHGYGKPNAAVPQALKKMRNIAGVNS